LRDLRNLGSNGSIFDHCLSVSSVRSALIVGLLANDSPCTLHAINSRKPRL
jgi:hypothetical protein